MNCKEFKDKVVDLFDTTINMQTQAECKAHMDKCPECKAYYEELSEAFNVLQPQEAPIKQSVSNPTSKQRHLWRTIAAAAIFLLGFFIGWSHLFSTPAVADNSRGMLFEQGIQKVQNVGSFQMAVYARTTPNENYAYFNPKNDFVRIDIDLLRQNDSVFYRVEKQGGRTLVYDGEAQYMWIPNIFYMKSSRKANYLENFTNLLCPERILTMQKSAIDFSNKNNVKRTETDSTIILTFEGKEKNRNLQQLLETGQMGEYAVEIENIFSKNDGLLRLVKLWVVIEGEKKLLLYIDDIHYNVMMNKNDLIQKPQTEWTEDIVSVSNEKRLKELQSETATQASQRILNAIISDHIDDATEALFYYQKNLPQLTRDLKNCKATNFIERHESSYPGTYVFYTLTRPDGIQKQRHIAVRNDNEQHIWILDGGL